MEESSEELTFFEKFREFHMKTPVLESLFNKVAATQVFSCEIHLIIHLNTYFEERLQTTTNDCYPDPSPAYPYLVSSDKNCQNRVHGNMVHDICD